MPIFDKRHVKPYLDDLDEYYQSLRKEVAGKPSKTADPADYHMNPEQFEKECVEIDFEKVEKKIEHFKVEVTHLKKLKKLNLPKSKS